MGCFLECFRIKDYRRRKFPLFSRFFSWKKRGTVLPRNQYASLVSSKEKATPSEKAEREVFQEKFYRDDCTHRDLRQEDKFRKTYDVILDTRIEINKLSDQHCVVSDSCKKINLDKQLDKSSALPSNVPETSTSSEEKSKSVQFEDHDDKSRKTMLFEEANKHPGVEKELDSVTLAISPQIYDCESPYPTPLNLVAGMLTPGTIHPPKPQNFRAGMIRTQFVYPVPDLSQRTVELKELSSSYNSPNVDKPVIGAVAAHWDEEELSCVSPKSWDGNGIPNSTTKYKEDQKVSWHATPFEVRLEKVLSDEMVQRKLDGKTD